jgi:hypothetical protein
MINKILTFIKTLDFKLILKTLYTDIIVFPLSLLTHPIAAFDDFKRMKKGKVYVSIIFVILFIITSTLNQTKGGFLLINHNPDDFDLLSLVLSVVFTISIFSIGNWSITSLFNGKGKLIEIFMVICYSIYPFTLLGIPLFIVGQFITIEELALFNVVVIISYVMIGYLIVFGLLSIHEYSLLETFITILVSLVAVALIIFIIILLLTIFEQFKAFIDAIIKEIRYRIR